MNSTFSIACTVLTFVADQFIAESATTVAYFFFKIQKLFFVVTRARSVSVHCWSLLNLK